MSAEKATKMLQCQNIGGIKRFFCVTRIQIVYNATLADKFRVLYKKWVIVKTILLKTVVA